MTQQDDAKKDKENRDTAERNLRLTEALLRLLPQARAHTDTSQPTQSVAGVNPPMHPDTDDKDIELVMMNAECAREDAIVALREHDNHLVEAIMSLHTADR
ncbi:hypothetical protein PMIN06_001764 [Paraphaeosphaeria minitans]